MRGNIYLRATIEEIVRNDICTGCGACANICPKNCITMIQDGKGFYIPSISTDCIECGKCKRVCPVDNCNERDRVKATSYAYYSEENSIKGRCSSSGVFGALAEETITRGGAVCGAAFDDAWKVRHIIVDKKDEIFKICTSKYSQSFIGENLYSQLKEELEKRIVLFAGTPCQVAGVKKIFKDNKNLITIDIVCHGVPSVNVWKLYLESLAKKRKIIDINFRDKKNINYYGLKILFSGEEFYESVMENIYMQGYINNLFLRNSCTICKFKGNQHCADITLGDLWRAEQIDESFRGKNNISWVIVNTNRGEKMLSFIKTQFEIKEVPIELANAFNNSYSKSVKHHKNREKFFREVESGVEICEAIRKNSKSFLNDVLIKKIERMFILCNVRLKRR